MVPEKEAIPPRFLGDLGQLGDQVRITERTKGGQINGKLHTSGSYFGYIRCLRRGRACAVWFVYPPGAGSDSSNSKPAHRYNLIALWLPVMVGIYMTTSVFVNEMLIPWADALHLRMYTCATSHFRRVVDNMAAFG